MMQLSSIRSKFSWPLLLVGTLYLGSVLIFVAVFLPNRKETKRLQNQVDQLLQNEQNLVRIVEQKPGLEKKQQELEEQLAALGHLVPSQYDLPEVLEVLTQLASYYGLKVEDLSHVPLQVTPGETSGVIPLTFDLSGSDAILSYLIQVQEILPSLQLTEVILGYGGDKQFHSAVRANLHVFVVGKASDSQWELPPLRRADSLASPLRGFGLPFEIVDKFSSKNVRVLGVVNGHGQSSALLAKDNVKRWVNVGDSLGEAIVKNIYPDGVMLDVDGVLLKLTIGG